MMQKFLSVIIFYLSALVATGQTINATTYPLTTTAGAVLEDMSTGTTQLIGPSTDNGASGSLQNIGFDFWYVGGRYTQYDVSANGYIRMGKQVYAPGATNDLGNNFTTSTQIPVIAPYWDDIAVGNDGKVHAKTIGAAPNRKLIVEWLNMRVPYAITNQPGNATFQLWLSETTGKIEFVYGNGMVLNSAKSGYSVGFNLTAASYAAIATATNIVSYTSPNSNNTAAIAQGTLYTFTPAIPAAPTDLNFTAVTGTSTTLNWTDNASNEVGFAICRSSNGGASYEFLTQTAANITTSLQSNLQPATNYLWKVLAVSNGGVSSDITGSQTTLAGTSFTSNGTGGGNWSNPATWTSGIVPTDADNITIKNGDIVVIDVAATAYNVTVGEGVSGQLQFEAVAGRTLNILNNLQILPGALVNTSTTGSVVAHVLNVNGNLANDGTLDLAGAATGASLRFGGAGNSLFSGAGAVNNIYQLGMAKQSIGLIAEVNVTNFTVSGVSTNATTGFLTGGTGTLKIAGNNTFSGTLSSNVPFTLAATFQLWLNNPNFTILGQAGDIFVVGTLKISQGTFNAGAAINNMLYISGVNARLLIEGGELNVAGKCSTATTATYEQRGGIVNLSTVGHNISNVGAFNVVTGANFIMTDGIMRLVQTNSSSTASLRLDYSNEAQSKIISGGKLIFGSAGVTTPIGGFVTFNVIGNMPEIELSAGITGLTLTPRNTADVFGNVMIPTNGRISIPSIDFRINDGTVTNDGSISVTASSQGGLFFTGTGAGCIYKGSGQESVTNNNRISRLFVDHPVGLTIDPATVNNLVVFNLFLQRGNIIGANRITVGVGSGAVGITIGSASGLDPAGEFDLPPTFNIGVGSLGLSYLGPSLSRSTGKEIPASRIIGSITINNGGAPLTIAGGNLQVTGTITLTSGNINMNGDTLTLGTSATATGTLTLTSNLSVLFNGKFRRWMPNNNGTARQFPVGAPSIRRNLAIAYTLLPTTGGTLTAEWIAAPAGSNGLPLTEGALPINSTLPEGYWKLTAADGLTGGVYIATATAQLVTGITDFTQTVLLKRTDNASPWLLDGTHVTSTGSNATPVLSRTGMVGFGEYAVGLPNISSPLTSTWTGAVSTAWENAGNWSNGVPGATTAVTIPDGMPRYPIINVNTSVKSIALAPNSSVKVASGISVIILSN